MKKSRRLLFGCLLLFCLVSVPGPLYAITPNDGTTSKLLSEWKAKIETLRNDLEKYKAQLIQSQRDLESLQIRLATLQSDLEKSSRDLTISIESSQNFSTSLEDLRESLQAEAKQRRRDHFRELLGTGAISAIVGAIIGALAVVFIS